MAAMRIKDMFQSPIGWGLSCEEDGTVLYVLVSGKVSIPYWLGSKLRE